MGKGGGPQLRGRREVLRAATLAKVQPEEIDRARVLGQLASLLLAHYKMRNNLAYKGGAIMHLVDGSPRRSNDLDANVVTAVPIKEEWIRQAFGTPAAKRVVFQPLRCTFRKQLQSITVVGLDCHAPSGRGKVQISINISWRAPLCLTHDWLDLKVGVESIRIPVVHRAERCAEKIDAFFNRDEVNDSYDLYHYAPRLKIEDWKTLLPEVVHVKLALSAKLPDGANVRLLFDKRLPGRAARPDKAGPCLFALPTWWRRLARGFRRSPTQQAAGS